MEVGENGGGENNMNSAVDTRNVMPHRGDGDGLGEAAYLKGRVSLPGNVSSVLHISASHLSLRPFHRHGNIDLDVPWIQVIGAKTKQLNDQKDESSMTLWYMESSTSHRLRRKELLLSCLDHPADDFVQAIHKHCALVEGRPKNLFVILNPIGGAKTAQKTYDRVVTPLLHMAHIATTLQITEKSKHALEIAENQDFSRYDGILVVGGDGLYQEVCQGLIKQTQARHGVNMDNPEERLQRHDIPIGIIPAGTGNGVSGWLNGLIDVETSVLNIIRGEQRRGMIYTIYSGGKFHSVSALLFAYGQYGDMIKNTDEKRWMGRARYPVCLGGMFLKRKRRFRCELELLQPHTVENKTTAESESDQLTEPRWRKYDNPSGEFCNLFFFTLDMLEKGDSFYPNYFGTETRFIIDRGCSNLTSMRTMYSLSKGKKSPPTSSTQEVCEKVLGFRLTGLGRDCRTDRQRMLEKIVDIDGEALEFEGDHLEGRLHPHFIPVYAAYP